AAAGPWFWQKLAYAADAPVLQRHLTFDSNAARRMSVSWMTPAPVLGPFVEVGGNRVEAETAQYPGYPGFFHHARLAGLRPGRAYSYAIGHEERIATTWEQFVTAPKERARFRFTAFGDQGTDVSLGVPPVAQPPNQASANTELAASFDPAFHLIVGDLAYANGDQSIWDDWFTMVEPMASRRPWMPLIGNHEIESQLDFTGTGDSWGSFGYDPYRTRFALPSNGFPDLANCFYAFRYAGVHFLMVDNNDVNAEVEPNIGYTEGRQRAWVESELRRVSSDANIDFIVVGMHQCAFSSSTKHGSDPGVQEAWFELFREHQVDLVLSGHDHVYERTHSMNHDEIVGEGSPYRTDEGTVYVTCGNGGAVQEVFRPEQPGWSAFRQDLKVGTLKVEVDPFASGGMARLTLSEHWALDGSTIEEGIVLERPRRRAVSQLKQREASHEAARDPLPVR
ncbi:MAG: purple acid phosphatase family protein, partial [Actinomycetota bacterium]